MDIEVVWNVTAFLRDFERDDEAIVREAFPISYSTQIVRASWSIRQNKNRTQGLQSF